MKIINFFINLFIFILLCYIVYYILYKYIHNTDSSYWIHKFNKNWKIFIHSLYFNNYFNYKTNTLYTDYELNNGLYLDLSKQLKFPTI